MTTLPISLRIPREVKAQLEKIAGRFGTNPATLGADYVTEGVRATLHPSIEFRQTPAGRMANLRGVRLPVWLVVVTLEDCGGDAHKAATLVRLPRVGLQAAV